MQHGWRTKRRLLQNWFSCTWYIYDVSINYCTQRQCEAMPSRPDKVKGPLLTRTGTQSSGYYM
eukprot:17394-Eustigmatos_ZCMA.PRE.1